MLDDGIAGLAEYERKATHQRCCLLCAVTFQGGGRLELELELKPKLKLEPAARATKDGKIWLKERLGMLERSLVQAA